MGFSNVRSKLQNLLLAIKATSLLTLGPLVAFGNFGSGTAGGLFGCPFSIPFVLCQACPAPCIFALVQPWLFGGIIVTSLLMGRIFCGLLCPIGIVSSLLYRSPIKGLSTSIFNDKLTYVKYGVVILFLYLMYEAAGTSLGFWPMKGLWSFLVLHRGEMAIVTMATVFVLLILSFFIYRPWCRYLCPIGVLISASNRFSLLSLKRDPEECGVCDACMRSCPLGLPDSSNSTDCIRCLSCYTACRSGIMLFTKG